MATLLPGLDEKNAQPQEIMERVTEGLPFEALGQVARAYGVTQETMTDWRGRGSAAAEPVDSIAWNPSGSTGTSADIGAPSRCSTTSPSLRSSS